MLLRIGIPEQRPFSDDVFRVDSKKFITTSVLSVYEQQGTTIFLLDPRITDPTVFGIRYFTSVHLQSTVSEETGKTWYILNLKFTLSDSELELLPENDRDVDYIDLKVHSVEVLQNFPLGSLANAIGGTVYRL